LDEPGRLRLDWNLYGTYNLYMSRPYTTSTARAQFADIVNRAEYGGERIVVHRRKRPVAAVVPIEDLELLERLEDEIDLADARRAMKEKGKSIPWAQVKKELNL
jgi:prevent-host-death family protein